MVHHIVMWKFKPEVEDAKKPELKKAMAENLKSLVGKVPGLLTVDFVEAPLASSTHDMALVTTLEKSRGCSCICKTSGARKSSRHLCTSVHNGACSTRLRRVKTSTDFSSLPV